MKFLDKLRNESEFSRQRFTIIATISISAIILIAWLLFVSTGSLYYEGKTDAAVASSTSPFAAVTEALSSFTTSFRGMMDQIKQLEGAASSSGQTDKSVPTGNPDNVPENSFPDQVFIDYPNNSQ